MAKYKDITLGQVEAVINKMGGAEIALAYLRNEYELKPIVSVKVGDMLVRRVHVNRNRTSEQVLNATGCKQYIDKTAVASIPLCEGDEVDVYFFKLGRNISCADLEKEYELRGLKPDPYAQASVNEADNTFADNQPNGSQWKDGNGNYTYVAFDLWPGGRSVACNRPDRDWYARWWFAGVRK